MRALHPHLRSSSQLTEVASWPFGPGIRQAPCCRRTTVYPGPPSAGTCQRLQVATWGYTLAKQVAETLARLPHPGGLIQSLPGSWSIG